MKDGYYGKGTGPVWKIRDGCHEDIAKCLLPASEHIDCNHNDDIGVYCLSEFFSFFSFFISQMKTGKRSCFRFLI